MLRLTPPRLAVLVDDNRTLTCFIPRSSRPFFFVRFLFAFARLLFVFRRRIGFPSPPPPFLVGARHNTVPSVSTLLGTITVDTGVDGVDRCGGDGVGRYGVVSIVVAVVVVVVVIVVLVYGLVSVVGSMGGVVGGDRGNGGGASIWAAFSTCCVATLQHTGDAPRHRQTQTCSVRSGRCRHVKFRSNDCYCSTAMHDHECTPRPGGLLGDSRRMPYLIFLGVGATRSLGLCDG